VSSNGFFLHGDVGNDGRAWCAVCRRFEFVEHFEEHAAKNADLHHAGQSLLAELGKVAKVMSGRPNMFPAKP
jgi:hypothetical protein